MRRSLLALLDDIRTAGRAIQRFTAGMTEADYVANEPIRRAVEREFKIIGEAVRRMSARHPEALHRITAAAQIIAFRNVLSHGYDVVEDAIVWSMVEKRLPRLLDEVQVAITDLESRH